MNYENYINAGKLKDPKECLRTEPDLVVFEPKLDDGSDQENQMVQVTAAPNGDWIAVWTTGHHENHPNQRVVYSRSEDKGRSWSEPVMLDGAAEPAEDGSGMASWAWLFAVPDMNRLYVFYQKNIGITDAREDTTGPIRYRISEDWGRSWSEQCWDIDYGMMGHFVIDHPDPEQPRNWFGFQTMERCKDGTALLALSRVSSYALSGTTDLLQTDSEITFVRFENILTETDPAKLKATPLPDSAHGLRVPMPGNSRFSMAQEPCARELSDGRFLCTFRTLTGRIYFAVSSDQGQSWSEPAPLCYEPGGEEVLNPLVPAPLFRLRDGRFLLKYYNNDGSANGGTSPLDWQKNRRPAFITVGREIPGHPTQPIRFGRPKLFADTDGVPIGFYGRTSAATYGCLMEEGDTRVFFYPDRKRFLLGKFLSDEWLRECDPGEA